MFFKDLEKSLAGNTIRMVYPEGVDERIIKAAAELAEGGIISPVVIGKPEDVKALAADAGVSTDGFEIIDMDTYPEKEEMVASFLERRAGRNTEEEIRSMLEDPNYFGTMLVYMGKVDGMVSGAVGSTGDTVRPALQIVRTKEGVSRISGAMLMFGPEGERYLFADIAINIDLSAEELAEVAVETAATAQAFGIDPKVAMLSFSTKGSAASPEQEKVAEATEIARKLAPELKIDGELQFDAAIDPATGASKAPGSDVAGHANVFIFPDLQSGNIGYKIAERLGGYQAIGPILQGLAAPIADLSRGCSVEDVVKLSLITGKQVLEG